MPKVKCPVCIASKAIITRGPQHQQLIQHQHPDRGKTFIRISQAKCASHPYADIDTSPSSFAHGQVPNIANLLHARITSSTHIVDSWQLQASSHNISARFEQIKEENTSTIRCKLSSKKHITINVVCAKDEHNSVRAAETAVNNLRHSTRAMMLHGNVPKRFWHFAIAHAAYIHNVTSPSRLDKYKTTFELLFSKKKKGRSDASTTLWLLRHRMQK